jgi:hypothetical protein
MVKVDKRISKLSLSFGSPSWEKREKERKETEKGQNNPKGYKTQFLWLL